MPEARRIISLKFVLRLLLILIVIEDLGVEDTVNVPWLPIMSPERNPTETSPLLGSHANGDAPHHHHSTTGAISNGYVHSQEHEAAERDHASEEAHQKQVANTRNSLRYIVPAVSIGVCQSYSELFYSGY